VVVGIRRGDGGGECGAVRWLNDLVERSLKRYKKAYIIQPFREQAKCAPACMYACMLEVTNVSVPAWEPTTAEVMMGVGLRSQTFLRHVGVIFIWLVG
jgi:hypothetical protein